jgi:hypothetical protein
MLLDAAAEAGFFFVTLDIVLAFPFYRASPALPAARTASETVLLGGSFVSDDGNLPGPGSFVRPATRP